MRRCTTSWRLSLRWMGPSCAAPIMSLRATSAPPFEQEFSPRRHGEHGEELSSLRGGEADEATRNRVPPSGLLRLRLAMTKGVSSVPPWCTLSKRPARRIEARDGSPKRARRGRDVALEKAALAAGAHELAALRDRLAPHQGDDRPAFD